MAERAATRITGGPADQLRVQLTDDEFQLLRALATDFGIKAAKAEAEGRLTYYEMCSTASAGLSGILERAEGVRS